MTAEITPAPGQIWRETASGQCVTIESVDAAMQSASAQMMTPVCQAELCA